MVVVGFMSMKKLPHYTRRKEPRIRKFKQTNKKARAVREKIRAQGQGKSRAIEEKRRASPTVSYSGMSEDPLPGHDWFYQNSFRNITEESCLVWVEEWLGKQKR